MSDKKLAYIGLGIMGSAMVANLAKAGCSVKAWNRTPGRPGEKLAAEAGAIVVRTIEEAVRDADIIFVCVNDVPDLEAVVLGTGAIAQSARPGAIVVDMGTSGPKAAVSVAAELKSKGVRFVDAPVTGGDVGARNATLTIMAGGDVGDVEELRPFFDLIGKKTFHCGPVGSGQGVKLCNQILCAVNLISVCEALRLADELEIDRKQVVEVCSTGAGGSWSLANLGPKVADSDFKPAFMIKLLLKDIKLIEETIAGSGTDLPGTELARRLFNRAVELGGADGGEQGTQAMFRAYVKGPT